MKKQESSDFYNVYCEGRKIYTTLTEEEMFDVMDDLSQQFYETGVPKPEDVMVELVRSLEA
jgi:hypothetical protein